MFSANPVVDSMVVSMMRQPQPPDTKKQKTSQDAADEGDKPYAIFPTKQAGPLTYGVGYEHFWLSPMHHDGGTLPKDDDDLLGEYDLIYTCFDAFDRRYYQQEGLYKEESLTLHRTVKGSLVLKRQEEGKLHGSLEFAPELKGTLVPSNGAFSFVEEGKRSATKIEYKVNEEFCWASVGTNTGPLGSIQVVDRRIPLGLASDDLSYASKFKFKGGYSLKYSVGFLSKEEVRRGLQKSEARMEAYDNVDSSYLCTQLKFPRAVAKRIRHFLYPPPMLYIEEGDLVLTTKWDNRDNTTYTIARRRNQS